ncbi:MAG: T9SS type A sorting domain-containing protein [Bacteroidales bacterium]|nr:T9SS type A sorting domain-containing protein [Bacteroidales bacterium]
MKKFLLFLLLGLFYAIAAKAQYHENIMISNVNGPNEPSIYLNMKNTDQMVAGANTDKYYYSTDGGYTWEAGTLVSPEYGVWGDPCIISDTTGSFYFFHLSNPQVGSWIDRIVCQKVDEPGGVWNYGTYMGLNGTKAQDKEWAIVDRTNNNIYVTWTQFDDYGNSNPLYRSNIMFSKSINGGETWSDAKRINQISGDCIDDDNTVEGAVPAVGPNGEIYVSWAGPAGLVFDKSLDGGETWLDDDVFVAEIPDGWAYEIPGISRCNGLPITVCDLSNGPNHGNIYINWSDQRNGVDDTDVFFVKSTDGGETWSETKRVNDDPSGKQQFFTWMCVDQITGYLYFVYYDRREYDDISTDVYMAVSKNGGETFTNFKISESSFIPNSNLFFGDYNNIVAHNNIIRPVWIRMENSVRSIWTAIINPYYIYYDIDIPIPLSLQQNYPNPFKDNTWFKFKLKRSSVVNLIVFDVYGRKISEIIVNEFMQAGKYERKFKASDYNLPPGIYYFSLSTEKQNIKRKMILGN